MRSKIQRKPRLLSNWIDHPHANELEKISELLDTVSELLALVYLDLVGDRGSSSTGREALSADLVLRALIVKQMNGLSYAELAFQLADSTTYRTFCRLGMGAPAPSKSALQRNIKRLRAETLEALNRVVLGQAAVLDVEPGRKVRVDTTVTKTNIHPPTDSSLLWDCIRVLTRLLGRAATVVSVRCQDHRRRAKRRWSDIMYARDEADRCVGYKDLLAMTRRTVRYAEEAVGLLEGLAGRRKARRLSEKLRERIAQTAKVLDQTHRRVFQDESVPSSEKLVSIFEEHTDIIVKDRRDTLYGHKISLTTGKSGLVLDCVIEQGNPADSTLAARMVQRQTEIFGRPPRQVAMDGGFSSHQNLLVIKGMGVKDVAFSKARGLSLTQMVKSSWVYRRLKRFRAGIEGNISLLKRAFGLDRCTWRGLESFKAYVWSSVLTANLLLVARHLLH